MVGIYLRTLWHCVGCLSGPLIGGGIPTGRRRRHPGNFLTPASPLSLLSPHTISPLSHGFLPLHSLKHSGTPLLSNIFPPHGTLFHRGLAWSSIFRTGRAVTPLSLSSSAGRRMKAGEGHPLLCLQAGRRRWEARAASHSHLSHFLPLRRLFLLSSERCSLLNRAPQNISGGWALIRGTLKWLCLSLLSLSREISASHLSSLKLSLSLSLSCCGLGKAGGLRNRPHAPPLCVRRPLRPASPLSHPQAPQEACTSPPSLHSGRSAAHLFRHAHHLHFLFSHLSLGGLHASSLPLALLEHACWALEGTPLRLLPLLGLACLSLKT